MVHPAVCLSWGGKLLIPGVWKACVGWKSANKHSTQHSTQMWTHTSTCKHTHTQSGDLCPAQIDFTQQLCTTVACQEPQWPLTPAINWPQCRLTLERRPATMGLSSPQSLCYSSVWSLGQSRVTEVPIELEQSLTKEFERPIVPRCGQCGVKVNWQHIQPCSERLFKLDFVAQLLICKLTF